MNSFLPLHKFERWDIVLFPNRYASELKIEMRELNDIQTFVYQLEGSNFEQFPFFNWTHGKSSCITCNKEISQKSFAHHRLYICKKYQKKQKANNSLTLDLITEADLSPFQRDCSRLDHICALWIKNYYINTQSIVWNTPL